MFLFAFVFQVQVAIIFEFFCLNLFFPRRHIVTSNMSFMKTLLTLMLLNHKLSNLNIEMAANPYFFQFNFQKYLLFLQVNLITGVPDNCASTTCTAGAGTLVLEFGILGRLLDDPTIELQARKVVDTLWAYKSNSTGLLGL